MKPWKIYKIKGFPMSQHAYGYFSFLWGGCGGGGRSYGMYFDLKLE